jgi:hypothetical protein
MSKQGKTIGFVCGIKTVIFHYIYTTIFNLNPISQFLNIAVILSYFIQQFLQEQNTSVKNKRYENNDMHSEIFSKQNDKSSQFSE